MTTDKKDKVINKEKVTPKKTVRRSKLETVVVSVGGSLIVPQEIDTTFMLALKRCLIGYVARHKRFIIVCGGGFVGRQYQQAAMRLSKLSVNEVDWMGIHGTRLNAHLVSTVLGDYSSGEVVTDPTKKVTLSSRRPIVVAGGWKPGWSTDYVAVRLAKGIGASRVVNLTDIDYVYDKDPQQYSDATAIKEIDWPGFRSIIPKNWDPGLSSPFDPVASKEAERLSLEVAVINGRKLAQFEHYLNSRPFNGTLIRPVSQD